MKYVEFGNKELDVSHLWFACMILMKPKVNY